MAYISKYDTKFVTFVTRKYKKYDVLFQSFDDYALWLYDFLGSEVRYYDRLEDDLMEYCKFQSSRKKYEYEEE